MRLLPQIPEPTLEPNSLLAALRSLRDAIQTLSINAGTKKHSIFAPVSSVGSTAALGADINSGADSTVNFTLDAPSSVLVMFSYTGVAVSLAGNLILSVDGNDLVKVPLATAAGAAYPMTAFYSVDNLGVGPHSVRVRSSTSIDGFSIAVLGSTRS